MSRFRFMRMLAWVAALILAPALAFADERPIRVELDYMAPTECPGRDAFVARIRQTNARVQPAEHTAPLGVKVRVARLPNAGYAAELVIRASDSDDTTRRLTASSCDEVMVAAAVVVAVLADTADAAQAKPRTEPSPTPPPTTPSADWEPPTPHPSGEPWHFGLGIDLASDAGLGPELEWQARPFVAISHARLALRLAMQRNSVSIATEDGTAATEWWLARTEACYRVTRAEPIALSPCLGFEAGSVSASGSRTSRPRDEARLVVGPLALVRLGIRLTHGLTFELDVGARVPLSRYRFVFGEDTTAYEMPGIALTSGIGVGFASP